jgi:ribosomal protein S18 acetylase RimI-like enzyme
MTEDIIENIQGSLVQHGHHNDRIYLMQLNTDPPETLIPALDSLARQNAYGKISAKVPAPFWRAFETAGYEKEAVVPGFFRGSVDGLFIAKYFSSERKSTREDQNVLKQICPKKQNVGKPSFQTHGTPRDIESCRLTDAAEMTDFATLPQWRGRGFAGRLLKHLHSRIRSLGIRTAYTIARAASHGMNSVFRKSGYHYAGVLKNNSQICGGIQSMTVWYKHLQDGTAIAHG